MFGALGILLQPVGAEAADNAPFVGFDLYKHRRWTVEDGAPPDIWAIAQSREGFLWLGTGAGLFRFDGVRFEQFRPAPGEALQGANIVSLLAMPSGDLWIGFHSGGVTLLRAGHLRNFRLGDVPGSVGGLASEGSVIWAAVQMRSIGGLNRFDGRAWHTLDAADGIPKIPVADVVRDSAGNIWAATFHQVYVKGSGQRRFHEVGQKVDGVPPHLVAAPGGGVWLVERETGSRFLSVGMSVRQTAARRPSSAPPLLADNLFFDRRGTMWGNFQAGGIFQVGDGAPLATHELVAAHSVISRYSTANGLTADQIRPFLEDREGTVWVGTTGGLDRFRLADILSENRIPRTFGDPYIGYVDRKGTIYVSTRSSLYALNQVGRPRLIGANLPPMRSLCGEANGSVWGLTEKSLLVVVHHGRSRPVRPINEGGPRLLSCASDDFGRIWLSVAGVGVMRQKVPMSTTFERVRARRTDADLLSFGKGDDFWSVDPAGRLLHHLGDGVTMFGPKDGMDVGRIQVISIQPDEVLVGGDLGLARYDGRHFQTLTAAVHPFVSRVTGIARRDDETWVFGIRGLTRVNTQALRAAFVNPGADLPQRLFDSRDGLPGSALQDWRNNTLLQSGRRLWLFTNNGVGSIDPDHLVANPVAPNVEIRTLSAGGTTYPNRGSLTLPKGITDIQIDYAPLSLAVPERVKVRYRLSGTDEGWIDPGLRRQAFFTNLAPGNYTFQVVAANDSGVWNQTGASIRFAILPLFRQTAAFELLCAAALLIAIAIAYGIRSRQIARATRMRVEVRMGERERIARELHDTLLQGIQGLMLRFQAIANRLPRDNDARQMIDRALDSAENLIVDGRSSLLNLRVDPPAVDLGQHVSELMQKQSLHFSARLEVSERGMAKPLGAVAYHEIARVAEEAIFNALRHAAPTKVEVVLEYDARHFALVVRDDGRGIDQAVLQRGGQDGHFGLPGMRERARRIRGRLVIAGAVGGGTLVMLKVPARAAYERTRFGNRQLLRFFPGLIRN